MNVQRDRFRPDPSMTQGTMEELQHDIARAAVFSDDHGWWPGATVAGVDQAFTDDRAVSGIVVMEEGDVVERVTATAPLEIPYIPGLLAFREGGSIVSALEQLERDPDLLLLDGSGRIHFREAGIATHIGVLFDAPAVGVAKNLLCGTPERELDDSLPQGTRVPIHADDGVVTAQDGTVIGHAYQSRQYDNTAARHINPLYVSPGHRVATGTATDIVDAHCTGHKLPEPVHRADHHVTAAAQNI